MRREVEAGGIPWPTWLRAGCIIAIWCGLIVLSDCRSCHGQTLLPRQMLDHTRYGAGIITNETAAAARLYLGITGSTNGAGGNTFNSTQFSIDADTNVVIRSGAPLTNAPLRGDTTFKGLDYASELQLASLLELIGQDFRKFGGSVGSIDDNYSAWTNAMAQLSDGDTLVLSGGMYPLHTNVVTKDINLVSSDGSGFIHRANADGDMLTWTVPGTGIIRGVVFDGNKDNQVFPTDWHVLVRSYGGGGSGQRFLESTFTDYMAGGIRDWNTTGRLEVAGSEFLDPYLILKSDTNSAAQYAIEFAPGIAGNRPAVFLERNRFVDEAFDQEVYRGSGGIALFGNDAINHVNTAWVAFNHFVWFGGEAGSGGNREVSAAIDWYRETRGTCAFNSGENIGFMFGKFEESQDLLVVGNWVTNAYGEAAYKYAPGERTQAAEYRRGVFRDNWAYRGTNDTIAFYVSAGDSGGWWELEVDGFYAPGFARGMQIEGLTGLGTREGYGPVTLRNVHITDATLAALQIVNVDARVYLKQSQLTAAGTGTALRAYETNTNMRLALEDVELVADTGYAANVQNLARFSAENTIFSAPAGTSAQLVNIGVLNLEQNNTIDSTVVTSAIADGYYWNGALKTHYPAAWTLTLGNGTTTYLEDQIFGNAGPALFRRDRNTTAGGSAHWTLGALGATLQFNAYDDTHGTFPNLVRIGGASDVGGVDWYTTVGALRYFGITSQDWYVNAVLGMSLNSTNLALAHNITFPGRAYANTWNGSTNGVTEDSVYDKVSTLPTSRTGVRRSLWIPATDMLAVAPATNEVFAATANYFEAILLDGGSTEEAQGHFTIPMTYVAEANWQVQIAWSAAAGTTGEGVRWRVSLSVAGADGDLATAAGASTSATGTIGTAATRLQYTTLDVPVTVAGTDPGDMLLVKIERVGGDGADTHASDVRLLGVTMGWTENGTEPSALP